MKKNLVAAIFILCSPFYAEGQEFDSFFTHQTLRIDYLFTGNATHQAICLDELSQLPTWAGREKRLTELPLQGNGQVTMRDAISKQILYRTSFSSLFQEWLETIGEAKTVDKGFENTFLLPFPKQAVEIEVTLLNKQYEVTASLTHTVSPDDILIHRRGTGPVTPHRYLFKNGSEEDCIDVAILAEGYKEEEMATFYRDAEIACESLFAHEPFKSLKKRFNMVAVASPSEDSGVSVPRTGEWKETAFGSHFDTFYSARYLTTNRVKSIHNALAAIPYEHIIILANTDQYGGGGIYNSFTLTTAHHPAFRPVVVHEFGHSFAGLADEYFYDHDDVGAGFYSLEVEPWEQNITTRVNFSSKWEDMLPQGTPVPTPVSRKEEVPVGVYEGGGYATFGIFRGSTNCRMRDNTTPEFCPVCQRAIRRIIDFYTVP